MVDKVDLLTEAFISEFGDLSEEKLNRKPDDDSWSIAQNVDHLISVNSSYFPVFDGLQEGTYKAPFLSRMSFVVGLIGKQVKKSVDPSRKSKTKTFPIWQPDDRVFSKKELWDRFERHQKQLMEYFGKLKPLADEGKVIASPASKSVLYRLDTAFDIIVLHEERHLEQARETMGKIFS